MDVYHVDCASFGTIPTVDLGGAAENGTRFGPAGKTLSNCVLPTIKARLEWYFFGGRRRFKSYYEGAVQSSDLVIVGGGQLIKNNVSLFCEKLALVSRVSRENMTPIAIIGVGVDRKMRQLNWITVNSALKSSSFICVRDNISEERIRRNVEADVDCSAIPDLAFGLRPETRITHNNRRAKQLAINIMNFDAMLSEPLRDNAANRARLFETLSSVISEAKLNGHDVVLFTTGEPGDFLEMERFREDFLRQNGGELKTYHPGELTELVRFLECCGDVVATRMHAGILAHVVGCNTVCVNWDDKVEGTWALVNQQVRVVQLDQVLSPQGSHLVLRVLKANDPPSSTQIEELGDRVRKQVLSKVCSIVLQNVPQDTRR